MTSGVFLTFLGSMALIQVSSAVPPFGSHVLPEGPVKSLTKDPPRSLSEAYQKSKSTATPVASGISSNSPPPLIFVPEWLSISGFSTVHYGFEPSLPEVASTLTEALDTAVAVTWGTQAALPFTGRAHPAAKNGTAAYIALKPGEESWLEATVNGPGRFDFWLLEIAAIPLPPYHYIWNYWALTINGQPVEISGNQWPEQWITGEGPHRIRLTFRHPLNSGVEWLAGAVDEVTWIPMTRTSLAKASGFKNPFWQTTRDSPANGFTRAGREGGPAIVMTPARWETSSAKTIVFGPCEVTWDSALNRGSGDATARLEVDGELVTTFESHSWKKMRLSLPRGLQFLRWVHERRPRTEYDDPLEPILLSQAWQISGLQLHKGHSPLAQALDFELLFALEIGDNGGQRVVEGRSDHWKSGLATELNFFDPKRTGKLTISYQSVDPYGLGWSQHSELQAPQYLPSAEPMWLSHISTLHPGGYSKWSFNPGHVDLGPTDFPRLASLKFDSGNHIGLTAALESSRPVISENWLGLSNRSAPVGRDLAWSLLNRSFSQATAAVTLIGPARVTFWWKKNGDGILEMTLDGAALPLPPPTVLWTKAEFAIASGNHTLKWTHRLGEMLQPSEAWFDGLNSRPTPTVSLTAAGTVNGSPELTSSAQTPEITSWQPVAYREADGTWIESARVVSGQRIMSATVTGPAVVTFRARCFRRNNGTPLGRTTRSVVIDIGDFGPTVTGGLLAVDVGGFNQLRVIADAPGTWTEHAVRVPAGSHEVTFRLMDLKSWPWGTFLADSTDSILQAWVADLQITSPTTHYSQWRSSQNLPEDQDDDDADADGNSNIMEYSFNTDPRDAASRPARLELEMFTSPNRIFPGPRDGKSTDEESAPSPYPVLKIPYLPSHVSGAIESSEDLINWRVEPITLLRYPASQNDVFIFQFVQPPDTQTHHFQRLAQDTPRRYYRLAIKK